LSVGALGFLWFLTNYRKVPIKTCLLWIALKASQGDPFRYGRRPVALEGGVGSKTLKAF